MQTHYERTGKLQRKIRIFRKRKDGAWYECSTNWHRTCREAVAHYAERVKRDPAEFFARFAK